MKPFLLGIFIFLAGLGWGYIIGDSRPTTVIEEKHIYHIQQAEFTRIGEWVLDPKDVEDVE